MSAQASGWVFAHSPYKGSKLLIHLALADVANDMNGNELWLTLANIATKARCSRSTTSAVLNDMVADGYLSLISEGGGRGNPSRYRFEFPEVTIQNSDGYETETIQSPTLNHPISDAKQSNPQNHPYTNPSKTQKEQNTLSLVLVPSPAESDPFDEFWDLYGKKVSRAPAQKAWAKALTKTTADAILDGLRRNLPELRSREPRFVPHPSTWLNAESWNDEPPPIQRSKGQQKSDALRDVIGGFLAKGES